MAVRTRRRALRWRARVASLTTAAAVTVAGLAVTASGATYAEEKRSLRDQLGAPRAIDLLASSSRAQRLRGIALLNAQLNGPSGLESVTKPASARAERAAKKRRNHARQVLVAALGSDGQAKTTVERLAIVRALADWAGEADVRQAFAEFGLHARSNRSPEIAEQIRGTAALALARSGDSEAYEQLGVMLRVGGETGDVIADALTAYPPKDPEWVVAGSRRPTVPFLEALSMHDTPAVRKLLRKAVSHTRAPIRAKAALVLNDLGDPETKGLAEYWLKADSPPVLQLAAFEILCQHEPAAAAAHLPRLLNRAATARAALVISRRCGAQPLTKPLIAVLGRDEDPGWVVAVMRALGAIDAVGDSKATAAVVQHFPSATTGALAARALAESEANAAPIPMAVMAAALRDEKARRNAARAVMGAWIQGGSRIDLEPAGLRPALEQLLASGSSDGKAGSHDASEANEANDDRALGAWGLSVLDKERGRQLLASDDVVVAAGAARGWLDAGRESASLAKRAAAEKDPDARWAFAGSLVDIESARGVPTSILVAWTDDAPLLAPLAARALAARDDSHARGAVQSLMGSPSVHIRSHVADGLGYATNPDAIARLRRLYLDGEATVRLAAVRALARRREEAGRPLLTLAARYDVDPRVRSVAGRGLHAPGSKSAKGAPAKRRFFGGVRLRGDTYDAQTKPLLIADGTGLLRPMRPAADGWIGFVGLEPGDETSDFTVVSVPGAKAKPGKARKSPARKPGTVESGP